VSAGVREHRARSAGAAIQATRERSHERYISVRAGDSAGYPDVWISRGYS